MDAVGDRARTTMPYAKLTITVPEEVWIGKVSREYPTTRFQVRSATANETTGVARVELIGPEVQAVCEEIRTYQSVTDLTVFDAEPRRWLVQVETTVPILLNLIQDSGAPLTLPFQVSDGKMALEATLPQRHLSQLSEKLDEYGVTYNVECIQQELESTPLLTDRQQWLLHEAIDSGYYDTPRRTTLTELANDLDIAKSTCSEVLHRAEESVLKEFITDEQEGRLDIPLSAD